MKTNYSLKTKHKMKTKSQSKKRTEALNKAHVSGSNFIPSGWDAFGKTVPAHRLMNAYRTLQEMIPNITTEKAFSIIAKYAKNIEADRPFDIIGNPTPQDAASQWMKTGRIKNKELDDDITMVDLCGRYRLMAVLMAG